MKTLSELFEITYGSKLDLNKMQPLRRSEGGINFVGRSSQNHGVSATVARVEGQEPYESGLITVALGGTKLLSSFVQPSTFYTAQNVAVLVPKVEMSFAEKLFICICIRHNRFRYSAFGREANRTLKQLKVPDVSECPAWLNETVIETIEKRIAPKTAGNDITLDVTNWRPYCLSELFVLKKGKRLTRAHQKPGTTPFIGAIDSNNGVAGYIDRAAIHQGNTITVTYNGAGVADAFYQPVPFWASDDVNVLYPKFKMTPAIALFINTVIRREKFRFSYGRKWHLERMEQTAIKLPAKSSTEPDYKFMETYIAHLPFSSQV